MVADSRRPGAVDSVAAVGLFGAVVVLVAIGSIQWFARDDWMFVLTRELQRIDGGTGWLFEAQNGHFMAAPVAVTAAVKAIFGLGSYWPFLLPTLLVHLWSVLIVRDLARRDGAGPWAALAVCGVLAVFGSGWENLVFAVQLTFNLSLFGFLAQLRLVDHRGPVDRRDLAGSALAVVAVASSGYGLALVACLGFLLAVRRRWAAFLLAVAPAVVVYGSWYVTFGLDDPAPGDSGSLYDLAKFAGAALLATASGLVGAPGLGFPLGVLVFVLIGWSVLRWRSAERDFVTPATVSFGAGLVTMAAVASQRAGLGQGGEAGRYLYMNAMLFGPLVAVAMSNACRRVPRVAWALGAVVAASIVLNVAELEQRASRWADDAAHDRRVLETLAGWDRLAEVSPDVQPIAPTSPDVFVRHLPLLEEWGAIEPRPPATLIEVGELERFLLVAAPGG